MGDTRLLPVWWEKARVVASASPWPSARTQDPSGQIYASFPFYVLPPSQIIRGGRGGPGPLVLRNFSRSFQCRPSQARPPGVTAASPVTQVPCRGPPRQSVCRGPSPPGALTIDTAGGRGLTEPRRPVLPETAAGETEQSSAEPPAPFRGRKSRWVC